MKMHCSAEMAAARTSGEAIPGRLARDAERLADRRPAHLALAQRVDRVLHRRLRVLEEAFLQLEPLQKLLGRHRLEFDDLRLRTGVRGLRTQDPIAEPDASIADEHARAGDQLRHAALALAAEGAMQQRALDPGLRARRARPRQLRCDFPDSRFEGHGRRSPRLEPSGCQAWLDSRVKSNLT